MHPINLKVHVLAIRFMLLTRTMMQEFQVLSKQAAVYGAVLDYIPLEASLSSMRGMHDLPLL